MKNRLCALSCFAILSSTLGSAQIQRSPNMGPQAQAAPLPDPTKSAAQAPFRVLDQVRGASIDLVFGAVRPMAFHPTNQNLYGVNSHNNTLVEYDGSQLLRTIPLPWGPVSVATWQSAGESAAPLILVVCRGSYTLACIESKSGRIVRLIELPAEPADIVIHPTSNNAFVSCSGDRSVVEIDLDAGAIIQRYPIPAARPTFLTLDGSDVLVAPMLSGNNSFVEAGAVIDLEDPRVAVRGLLDHDLFRITPGSGVSPAASDMGSTHFALGLNPVSGELWQLGTEAKNKDPKRRGEPALRGDFIANQISIARLDSTGVVRPLQVIDLDDTDRVAPGVQFDPTRSVGQPYALAFDAAGQGYVAGLLSQNVTQLAADGSFVREWNVGSIPRAILVDAAGKFAWVSSWGDNQIEVYDLHYNTPKRIEILDLGFDPTSALEQAGRRLFFDAGFSMHGNASCASCHVETGTDLLAWDLSDLPFDDKGPLVTQTMRGIGDHFPLHWRGERARLSDFNGAFDGLLGGPELDRTPNGEFDQFEAYIKSLQQPANPGSHPARLVDASLTSNGGNALAGQDFFFDAGLGAGSCNLCHALPTGSNREPMLGVTDTLGIDRRATIVVPSFNGLWRKEQPTLENVVLANGRTFSRPTNGSGFISVGSSPDFSSFLDTFFTFTDQQNLDMSAFMAQIDSGLAPAVHRSWLLNQASVDQVGAELEDYLLDQAEQGNADIAVFGKLNLGHGSHELRWTWDPEQTLFLSELSSIPGRSLDQFLRDARDGRANLVFLGLPVGMGERFAVDFDADDLFNLDERQRHTNPELADSDGDGFPDGHEVLNAGDPLDPSRTPIDITAPAIDDLRVVFITAKSAKLQFTTDEPASVITSWVAGSLSGSAAQARFTKSHTVILTNLRYSQRYSVSVSVTDQGGNTTTEALPGVLKVLRAVSPTSNVLRQVSTDILQNDGGVLNFTMTGQGHFKVGARPSVSSRLTVNVFVNGTFSQTVSGTFAGSDGFTTVNITESGLAPGDVIRVTVESLGTNIWNMPETSINNRERSLIYDGLGI